MKRLLAKTLVAAVAVSFTMSGAAFSATSVPTPKLATQILMGNYGAKWSYDAFTVDPQRHVIYVTNRSGASVDVVDENTDKVIDRIKGFTGFKGKPETSGPNMLIMTDPNTGWVNDVGHTSIVDLNSRKIVGSVYTDNTGQRTDGGCFDPADRIVELHNADDDTPSIVFYNADTRQQLARMSLPGSGGIEGCQYDPVTKLIWVAQPTTKANGGGELDALDPADIKAGSPKFVHTIPTPGCEPNGIAIGPTVDGKPQVALACDMSDDGNEGDAQFSYIASIPDGALTKIPEISGADQVVYNPKYNEYLFSARNNFASGKIKVGSKGAVLGIVDAGGDGNPAHWVANIPACHPMAKSCKSGSHAVASDPETGRTFVPVGSSSADVLDVFQQ